MDTSPDRSDLPAAGRVGLVALASALLVVVVLGGWWWVRSARAQALDAELAPYAGVLLPAPDAPVDGALADLGARVFQAQCVACHAVSGEAHVGPNLAGVTERRTLPWIAAMILRPDSMLAADPVARALREEYGVPMMVPGGIDETRTRAVIEFLRRADGGAG